MLMPVPTPEQTAKFAVHAADLNPSQFHREREQFEECVRQLPKDAAVEPFGRFARELAKSQHLSWETSR
jgi:hypothetical protein